MSTQLNILDLIEQGQRLRDEGIQTAIDHANDVYPGWGQKVFNLFSEWIEKKGSGRTFKTEDFRIEMELSDKISKPPHGRAYGSLAVRAAKAGLIKKVGYASVTNPKAHMANCTLWQVV